MRRADRLFQIVQLLRRQRVTTAANLASELGVSERTIYRDVQDLILSGLPIRGEAGVGYALPRNFELPPLMFSSEEIEALVLGARIVKSWSDPSLARAADSALTKIELVLPERLRSRIAETTLFAPSFHIPGAATAELARLRAAIVNRQKVRFAYTRKDGMHSDRTVRPLGLFFWGSSWSATAWCELRNAFRNFRLDRMAELRVLDEQFTAAPGQTLEDFLKLAEDWRLPNR
jgi:predicted DNA-binding transcriptional regulator YafY